VFWKITLSFVFLNTIFRSHYKAFRPLCMAVDNTTGLAPEPVIDISATEPFLS